MSKDSENLESRESVDVIEESLEETDLDGFAGGIDHVGHHAAD